jgi:hypothetical protein
MSALIVKHDLPAEIIALPQEIIEKKDELIEHAHALLASPPIASVEQWRAEEAVAKSIGSVFKAVEDLRLQLGRKLKAVADQVNAGAAEALVPLKETWQPLMDRCKAFERAENERRAEEARKAREEQERLQREEEARAAATAEEARQRAEMEAEPGEAPASTVFVPEAVPKQVERAFVPPPLKSTAAAKKGGMVVVIDDESKIPFQVNGMRLWKEPNLSQIKALLSSGIAVTGCHLVEAVGYAMKGGR